LQLFRFWERRFSQIAVFKKTEGGE
jgi:hypothetical protein